MQTKPHITFGLPTDWSNDQRGDFFERFVADLLRPMRFSVVQRIRFAGMEIELLAKGEDRPFSVLVECKAHRDPIPGEAISKLLGNVFLRKADAGWLFSTSDLTKEARGQWEEIQGDAEQCRKFTWYPPGRLCDILVSQGTAQSLDALTSKLKPYDVGDATLVIRPDSWFWLIELVEGGLPAFFAVFDAKSGQTVSENVAVDVASFSTRYGALKYVTPTPVPIGSGPAGDSYRAAVARVISGEGWDDPRPARPSDFVGRDDLIQGVGRFLEGVGHLGRQRNGLAAPPEPERGRFHAINTKLDELSVVQGSTAPFLESKKEISATFEIRSRITVTYFSFSFGSS